MSKEKEKFSLLLVDDHPVLLATLKKQFAHEGYQIHTATDGHAALAVLQKHTIAAALVDLKMPGMDGLRLLKEVRRLYPEIMVVMLTAHSGVKEAVEAMRLGAVDYLEKPCSPEGIRARVAQLARIWMLREENRRLQKKIEFQFGYDRLIGSADATLRLKEMITRVSPADASILIQGETGSGKELVARAIHHHSSRSGNNFVPVDCGAINETVIESELFGHVKGAYTGAHSTTLGLLRAADQGTLFLDEIGELSLAMQVKLLRAIQEGEVRPVGSTNVYQTDFRLIAATNRDLAAEVEQGRFREDLYFRLNVLTITVPPLRDRRQDIADLSRYFIRHFRSGRSQVTDFTPEALVLLEQYHWPGNIRELENVIKRALALARYEHITPADLPDHLQGKMPSSGFVHSPPLADDTLVAYEKAAIGNALRKSNNNRRQAASILGIGEATLYRKIQKYGI